MKAADWIVDFLISKDVTDVFGLPGAVVLELLYAMDRRRSKLTPHLNYHEQGAAFAACGYAQATGKLGVAYATRGPLPRTGNDQYAHRDCRRLLRFGTDDVFNCPQQRQKKSEDAGAEQPGDRYGCYCRQCHKICG